MTATAETACQNQDGKRKIAQVTFPKSAWQATKLMLAQVDTNASLNS